MSAFGTKKPGGSEAVQLTFPAEFSRAYKLRKMGERFAASAQPVVQRQEYVGDDMAAQVHRERRADAHRMVLAAVQSAKNSERRMLVSHANYYGMPAPLLTQRRIGSNIGVGGGFNSALGDSGLVGGVIGTPEGRAWVQESFRRRIAELNAIDANEFGMPLSRAVSRGEPPESFGELSRMELVSFLDQLLAQVSGRRIEFSPETFRRFFALLVRFAAVANKEELDDVYERIDEVLGVLLAEQGGRYDLEYDESEEGKGSAAFGLVLSKSLLAARTYVKIMYGGITLSERDRRTLSRAALRDAGFVQLNKYLADLGVEALLPDSVDDAASTASFSTDSTDSSGRTDGRRRLGTDIFGSATFSSEGENAEISSGPRIASTAHWSNTLHDQLGRQGTSELRSGRSYAGEANRAGMEQAGEDYEAEVEEAATGADFDLSRIRQANTDQDFKEGEEGVGATSALLQPPMGDYFDTWVSRGYQTLEGTEMGNEIQTQIRSPADIDRYLAQFRGQAGLPALIRVGDQLKRAKGLTRPITSEKIYNVKKTVREMLQELF
jgi:hypothetical protein